MKDVDFKYYKDGLWVIAKGLDTWDYYEIFKGETTQLMNDFAFSLNCFEEYFETVNYNWQ